MYRKQGKSEAADQLDNCAVKIKRDVKIDEEIILFFLLNKYSMFSHQQSRPLLKLYKKFNKAKQAILIYQI